MTKICFTVIFVHLFMLAVCNKSSDKQEATNELPRIAIAGLSIESSTFSPALTHLEAFNIKISDSLKEIAVVMRDICKKGEPR